MAAENLEVRRPISPPWSITTVRSLDISSYIPHVAAVVGMDAEDSPWGDVPSSSSSKVNQSSGEDPLAAITSPAEPVKSPSTPKSSAPRNARGARGARGARRVDVQTTRLEALDDNLGPLGPLGDNAPTPDPAPTPPSKEQTLPVRSARQAPEVGAVDTLAEASSFNEDLENQGAKARPPPKIQPSPTSVENAKRQSQPSMSVEQAAKPSFNITVGDPHKVGDMTSSHIVYSVITKTTSKAYKQPEFTVTRRYRDFLWLYTALHNNNPGVVVPPPPEKQAVGRFDTNFVEARRAALERMLNRVTAHPILQHDSDLKIFLESDAFNVDIKHREHKEPGLGENKGMFSSFGLGTSGGQKFIEHDDWFHDRKIYLDALENQLRALLKAMEGVIAQRRALAEAAGELSQSLHSLSTVEIAPSLSGPLEGLSDIQLRIRELYERQAQQDVLTLGNTIDEYIRLIGSVKMAFQQRQKSYHTWHTAEAELAKRKTTQDKLMRSGKSQQDRLNQLQADVADGERKCHQARLLFEDMGRLMRGELERFEKEKVEDFKNGVETFLEGAVEAQKELIEIWETYLMQFDADEDEEPFFKPQVMQTEPIPTSGPPAQGEQQKQGQGQQQQPVPDSPETPLPPGHNPLASPSTPHGNGADTNDSDVHDRAAAVAAAMTGELGE